MLIKYKVYYYSAKYSITDYGQCLRLLFVASLSCLGYHGSTFGARAFAIAGPTVWNSLPDSLRDPAVWPVQFRRDLKTHLFE